MEKNGQLSKVIWSPKEKTDRPKMQMFWQRDSFLHIHCTKVPIKNANSTCFGKIYGLMYFIIQSFDAIFIKLHIKELQLPN